MTASARAEPVPARSIADAPPALDVARMFREHCALVERALRRSGVADVDLADARQEVFIVVHRRLAEFEARSSVTTWLYGIAYHVARDFRRRAARRNARSYALTDGLASGDDGARAIEQRDALLCALRAIDRLTPDRREVFVLHELCELPMREVAARLRCPLKTAFSRLYAARRALLGELRQSGALVALPPWPWLLRPAARIAHAIELRMTAQVPAWKVVALASVSAVCLWSSADPAAPARAPLARLAPALIAAPAARAQAPAPRAPSAEPVRASDARQSPARGARRTTAHAEAIDSPAPAAPAAALASAGEFEVIRASAVDLRPVGWNPFAAEIGAPAPLRVHVIGPLHAAEGVESAFGVDHADL